jgi:acylphosphatase
VTNPSVTNPSVTNPSVTNPSVTNPSVTNPSVNGPPAPIRRRVIVAGRVQGVGFRYSCRTRAEQAGVGGWVRNLADGRVEAAFEGPAAGVDALIDWCRTGPPLAAVTSVVVNDEAATGAAAFVIR